MIFILANRFAGVELQRHSMGSICRLRFRQHGRRSGVLRSQNENHLEMAYFAVPGQVRVSVLTRYPFQNGLGYRNLVNYRTTDLSSWKDAGLTMIIPAPIRKATERWLQTTSSKSPTRTLRMSRMDVIFVEFFRQVHEISRNHQDVCFTHFLPYWRYWRWPKMWVALFQEEEVPPLAPPPGTPKVKATRSAPRCHAPWRLVQKMEGPMS